MKNYQNGNNSVNQNIKGDFINREVYACLTREVEFILSTESRESPFSYDDIENYYISVCPDCGSEIEETENDEDETVYKCTSCDYESDEQPDTEAQEIYEWYLVSEYLADLLKDKNEPVIITYNSCYWGRCCSGQAIKLDGVITDICSDIEILDGQKYEWNK